MEKSSTASLKYKTCGIYKILNNKINNDNIYNIS